MYISSWHKTFDQHINGFQKGQVVTKIRIESEVNLKQFWNHASWTIQQIKEKNVKPMKFCRRSMNNIKKDKTKIPSNYNQT